MLVLFLAANPCPTGFFQGEWKPIPACQNCLQGKSIRWTAGRVCLSLPWRGIFPLRASLPVRSLYPLFWKTGGCWGPPGFDSPSPLISSCNVCFLCLCLLITQQRVLDARILTQGPSVRTVQAAYPLTGGFSTSLPPLYLSQFFEIGFHGPSWPHTCYIAEAGLEWTGLHL